MRQFVIRRDGSQAGASPIFLLLYPYRVCIPRRGLMPVHDAVRSLEACVSYGRHHVFKPTIRRNDTH